MIISPKTRIADLLHANPLALEAIVSLSPKFSKLRNPVMRSLMAPRANIQMACKVGDCEPEDFYRVLRPLGFRVNKQTDRFPSAPELITDAQDFGSWLEIFQDKLETVDVRELEMPMPMITILDRLDNMPEGKALLVYHKRIPVFLIPELFDRGLEHRIMEKNSEEVQVLIFRKP